MVEATAVQARAFAGRCGSQLRLVIGADAPPPLPFTANDALTWNVDPAVSLQAGEGGTFALLDHGASVLSGTADPDLFRLALEVGHAEIVGFGAANGARNRNDSRFRVMTIDTLLYAIPGASYTALPFFIVRSRQGALGVLLATALPLDVHVGEGKVCIAAACDTGRAPIDLIVFRGGPAEIVGNLAGLVGRSFLPPAWALGFHQSRWSYRTARAVLAVARKFRTLDLPADAVHLDIHYMDRYRVFTFHPRRFADPTQMHATLRDLGFRTLAIVDPGVSVADYHAYRTLHDRRVLLARSDGTPYVGRVWPGATVFPDFSRPDARRAWADLHAPLIEAGVAGFWNDMNDPVLRAGEYYDPLTEDVRHHGNVPHGRVRNLYANGMAEATACALAQQRPGRRPFVLSRSGFLGIQRHAAIWTGDNHSTWAHLRGNLEMVINLGLSGVPLAGADVGGFARGPGRLGIFKPARPSAELFVRWMELGALLPFFRVHCTLFARSQDPWSFGGPALAACRCILRRRYRLLPLLYRLALEAHEEGLPIVRPLWMHYDIPPGQDDGHFLIGSDVLAAPVLERGSRRRQVHLPRGARWVDWHSGRVHDGGTRLTVDAPFAMTPLFVRAGTALFTAEPSRNADDTLSAPLALEMLCGSTDETGRGSLFLDDGESADGRRFVLDATVEQAKRELRVRLDRRVETFLPAQGELELRVHAGRFEAAVADGRRIPLERRSLQSEDRATVVDAAVVPLVTSEVCFTT
jgi:alpha-glucosidase